MKNKNFKCLKIFKKEKILLTREKVILKDNKTKIIPINKSIKFIV